MPNLLNWLGQFSSHPISTLEQAFLHFSQPSHYSIAPFAATDLPRSKFQLIAENLLLRQQSIILQRKIEKPRFTQSDRLWLVLLASHVQHWKDALIILKPDTVLRWVAVGTIIADRPRTDPDMQHYRIQLLPRVVTTNRWFGKGWLIWA